MLSGRAQNPLAPLAKASSALLFFVGAGQELACALFRLAGSGAPEREQTVILDAAAFAGNAP